MDGFGGYKITATHKLPEASAVMDPFHVVALAGAKLDLIRQRIQQATCRHRGRTGDPLYGVRRNPAHPIPAAHHRPTGTPGSGVRRGRPPSRHGDLECVPANHRRLQPS